MSLSYQVLVVDDDALLIDLMRRSLTDLGAFTVIVAEDGAAGLEACVSSPPDCAIIDVHMPELNGYQLVKALRGDPATARIPLVILTAMATDHARFDGLAAGADIFLIKPIMPQDLVLAVRQAIQRTEEEWIEAQQALADQPLPEA